MSPIHLRLLEYGALVLLLGSIGNRRPYCYFSGIAIYWIACSQLQWSPLILPWLFSTPILRVFLVLSGLRPCWALTLLLLLLLLPLLLMLEPPAP